MIEPTAYPVETIALFAPEGDARPLRFRLPWEDGAYLIVTVETITKTAVVRQAGNPMQVFDCLSQIDGTRQTYQLRFEPNTGRWFYYVAR